MPVDEGTWVRRTTSLPSSVLLRLLEAAVGTDALFLSYLFHAVPAELLAGVARGDRFGGLGVDPCHEHQNAERYEDREYQKPHGRDDDAEKGHHDA